MSLSDLQPKEVHPTQPVLIGNAFERGRQMGELTRTPTMDFLGKELAHINLVRENKVSKERALEFIKPHIKAIEKYTPDLASEIDGLSTGIGISYEDAMLLQLRRELLTDSLECSLYAEKQISGRPILAQNIDLPGQLEGLFVVFEHHIGDLQVMVLTHYGLLGFLGVNNKGLAIGINMVLAKGWRPGVPPYLLIRYLLTKESIEECLEALSSIPRSSSRCLTIMDREKLASIEMTVDHYRTTYMERSFHTNHYLHPDLKPEEQIKNSACSYPRYQNLTKLFSGRFFSVEEIKKNMAYHQVPGCLCLHDPNPANPSTVASAVLLPEEGRMDVAFGPPCQNLYHTHVFVGWLR